MNERRAWYDGWPVMIKKHYGPGPHPGTGTPQAIHAGARGRRGRPREAGVTGHTTEAFGNDPNKRYSFRTKVVSLDDLIVSNTVGGAVNPDYDQTLQPRARDRTASQLQIDNVAKNMVPEALLVDFHQLDKGPPITGDDMMVEAGNGRILALRRAKELYPERWAAYQKALGESLEENGIDPADVKGLKNPVLIRERVSKVDRAEFARESNAPSVLQMSPLEKAKQDRRYITPEAFSRFSVGEGQSVDQALRSAANRPFVQKFVGQLPQNERATIMRADGSLNRMGLWRIKAAMFSRTFPGEAGDRMADTFFESTHHDTKNFENAMGDVLPKMAQAESLIATGRRRSDLSLATDISKAIDMHARLKEMGLPPRKYLAQTTMFKRELTPDQDRLLIAFEKSGRSRKAIRGMLNAYADGVINSPDPRQAAMFGGMRTTKSDLIDRMVEAR